jgi:hypothetical protein
VLNLLTNHDIEVSKMAQDMKVANDIKLEYQDMLESLEEAIVVSKQNEITF